MASDAVRGRRRAVSWASLGPDQLAPRVASRVVAVVLSVIALLSVVNTLADERSAGVVVLDVCVAAAVLVLQLKFFSRRVLEFPSRAGMIALGVQVLLVYVPFFVVGPDWVGIPGFLAGSALLALPSPASWAAFAGVVVSVGALQTAMTGTLGETGYAAISTAITGLVVYGFSRLISLVRQLQAARAEIATMAVANERLRMAQDLHDLLGYSLSAITLKSELTRHLLDTHPDRAAGHLDDVLELSRQALTDVRSVAHGARDMSVFAETRSAQSLLHAAEIDLDVEVDEFDLPVDTNTALATILREGVTNLLRHSDATHARIRLDRCADHARLLLANDGVGPHVDVATRSGSGLDSLTARVATLGGAIDMTVHEPAGWFSLEARIPLAAAPVG